MLNDYLQTSAQLYKHLTEIPAGDDRTEFIEKIHRLLDDREISLNLLKKNNFKYDETNKSHLMIKELEKGIELRLDLVMEAIKKDIKELYNSKKNERQYIDPYEGLRSIEGRYYDGKK